MLPACRLNAPNVPKAKCRVKRDRARLGAADYRNQLAKPAFFGLSNQFGKQARPIPRRAYPAAI